MQKISKYISIKVTLKYIFWHELRFHFVSWYRESRFKYKRFLGVASEYWIDMKFICVFFIKLLDCLSLKIMIIECGYVFKLGISRKIKKNLSVFVNQLHKKWFFWSWPIQFSSFLAILPSPELDKPLSDFDSLFIVLFQLFSSTSWLISSAELVAFLSCSCMLCLRL